MMNKRHFQRAALLTCGLTLVLVAVPVVLTWRAWKQQKVNQMLITAISENNSQAVAASLEAGANPNAFVTDTPLPSLWTFFQTYWRLHRHNVSPSRTPIFRVQPYALDRGGPYHVMDFPSKNVKILKLLLDYGADINAQDELGCTELMHAVAYNETEEFLFLVKRKASVQIKDKQGSTALSFATMLDKREYVRVLQQAGAKE